MAAAAEWIDEWRRQIGRALDAVGIGPEEAPHRIAAAVPGARLRAYFPRNAAPGPVVLIVQAPFKRAYIWDLLPQVSVVRHCLARGARVYLLEWTAPTGREDGFGLAEYACRLPGSAIDAIEAETGVSSPVLAGHSLGGTFAAIYATLFPDRVGGLVLIDAPLAFAEHGGPLARAVAMAPHARLIRRLTGSPVAGSVVGALSAAAAPDVFHAQRHADLLACLLDPEALAVHLGVERWSCDELALPGQLFEDVFERLYREDRLLRGRLGIGSRRTGIARLRAPVMAVVNPAGGVVPPASIRAGLAGAPDCRFTLLEHGYAHGPVLQHLGPLVTPSAHARLWPRILDWIDAVASKHKRAPRTASYAA
ncbi:MAG: alpha/beta fold hydrolase [Hyphomicrobiaceae bacterium]|nr:alpha/beta fold hydrolase [Hyphomicrobiaceae bacterium]